MTLHVLQTKLRHVLPEKLKLRRSSHSEVDYSSITNHENATAGNSISLLLATRILQPSGLSASSFSAMMIDPISFLFISTFGDLREDHGHERERRGRHNHSIHPLTHPLRRNLPYSHHLAPYSFTTWQPAFCFVQSLVPVCAPLP